MSTYYDSIRDLNRKVTQLDRDIRALRSRFSAVFAGDEVIGGGSAHGFLSTQHVDTLAGGPLAGAMVRGNVTPEWERLPPPSPAVGTQYQLRFDYGDTVPSWKLAAAPGDDVFLINMAVAL